MSPSRGQKDETAEKVTALNHSRKEFYLRCLGSALVFVVLALGLGLGLGLGLKHYGDKTTSTRPSASPAPSPAVYNTPLGNQSWRRNTSEYTLDMTGWDLNAPPTTRSWNFTLSEIEAYPDGTYITMLWRLNKMSNGYRGITTNACD
jgi:hypothetical protein